jgi:hypothetical protein
MPYVLNGNLRGSLCDECIETLAGVGVRIYAAREVRAAKDLAVLTHEQVQAAQPQLLAEAETNEAGDFVARWDDGKDYTGGPVQVDLVVASVKGGKGRQREPVQFTAAVFQPEWTEGQRLREARWSYLISVRLWCFIRGLFDAWVICGHVRDCRSGTPLAGVKVLAFDVDWLQDDALGTDVTDAAGHFRIDYTSADFKRTIFSPFINLEWVGGPDIRFRIETADGDVLLNEPRSRGRKADRENRGPCFCVDLCVDAAGGTPPYENPYFTHVGVFNILSDITWATGLANGSISGVGGAGWAFTGNLKLNGYCPKKKSGTSEEMYYRFLVEVDGTTTPVTGGMLEPVMVGSRLIDWDLDGNGTLETVFQSTWIQGSGATADLPTPLPPGTPGGPPAHVVVPDSEGWIKVDQRSLDGGFYGPLLRLRSGTVVPGGASTSAGAGNAVPAASQKHGRKVKIVFQTTTNPADPSATVTQLWQPTVLVDNWVEVRDLWLQQFSGPGNNACSKLSSQLDIDYTVHHDFVRSWSLGISSAASGLGWVAPALPSGTAPVADSESVSLAGWPPCSYTVTLSSQLRLTDGEGNDDAQSSSLTFCIC